VAASAHPPVSAKNWSPTSSSKPTAAAAAEATAEGTWPPRGEVVEEEIEEGDEAPAREVGAAEGAPNGVVAPVASWASEDDGGRPPGDVADSPIIDVLERWSGGDGRSPAPVGHNADRKMV